VALLSLHRQEAGEHSLPGPVGLLQPALPGRQRVDALPLAARAAPARGGRDPHRPGGRPEPMGQCHGCGGRRRRRRAVRAGCVARESATQRQDRSLGRARSAAVPDAPVVRDIRHHSRYVARAGAAPPAHALRPVPHIARSLSQNRGAAGAQCPVGLHGLRHLAGVDHAVPDRHRGREARGGWARVRPVPRALRCGGCGHVGGVHGRLPVHNGSGLLRVPAPASVGVLPLRRAHAQLAVRVAGQDEDFGPAGPRHLGRRCSRS